MTTCPHGVTAEAAGDAWEVDYKRTQGKREGDAVQWICSCCKAPAGESPVCATCSVEVTG